MRVLIVDESHAMRRLLAAILAHLGLDEVVEVTTGPEAVQEVQRGGVRLIIADWNLARMDIADFVRGVRMRGERTPLLLMATVMTGPYVSRSILPDPTIDCVVKPFTVAMLQEKVIGLLRRGGEC